MRTTRTWLSVVASLAIAVAATGCSGGSDAAPLTTVAPTAPATDDAPPPTEAATTTTTTTTTPPPTTLGPDAIKAEVEARFLAYDSSYDSASYDLDDFAARAALLEFAIDGGDSAIRIAEVFDRRLSAGQRVRPNTEIPNRLDIFGVELIDEATAVVDFCRINSDIIYEPDGLGEGIELIVNDDFAADRVNTTMQLEQGVWKVLKDQRLERYEGETACPES